MYQMIAVAVVVLMLGNFLKHRIAILERFCIPAPVISGVIFCPIFTCVCYVTGFAEFSFDDILKEVCMVFFFTSIWIQANLKVLKSGGKSLIISLIACDHVDHMPGFLLQSVCQALQIDPLDLDSVRDSIPMIGGRKYSWCILDLFLKTLVLKVPALYVQLLLHFGLIAGSIMGGPDWASD